MPYNPRITQWSGKAVWLVGASSGIGLATASALHAAGATVIVSARNAAALEDFAALHPGSAAVQMDVTDAASVAQAARAVLSRGDLHGLVYCAGHYRAQRATSLDLADMLRHQDVNYNGALRVLNAVLPHFLERGCGFITLIASVAGFRGLPQGLAYGPTKAALINLAETLYQDLRESGIAVSVVNPGFVETPLTAQNRFAMPGLMKPEAAAREMLGGWARGDFETHFPKRFTRWMKLLRVLPYALFFRAVRRITGL